MGNLAQIGSDFFAQLDLGGHGEGDVWVKIVGSILDLEGNELTPDQIESGARLKVTDNQQNEAGFVEAYVVVLISAAAVVVLGLGGLFYFQRMEATFTDVL